MLFTGGLNRPLGAILTVLKKAQPRLRFGNRPAFRVGPAALGETDIQEAFIIREHFGTRRVDFDADRDSADTPLHDSRRNAQPF